MSISESVVFVDLLDSMPSPTPYYRDIYPDHDYFDAKISAWMDLVEILSDFQVHCFNRDLKIQFDWSGFYGNVESIHRYIDEFNRAHPGELSSIRYVDEFRVKCFISPPSLSDQELQSVVAFVFGRIFLALNIVNPGSCDFGRSVIRIPRENGRRDSVLPLLLSSKIIEHGLDIIDGPFTYAPLDYEPYSGGWPELIDISIDQAWQWLGQLDYSLERLASPGAETALYALLYALGQDRVDPSALIWLTHALESLYDTPRRGITKALKERPLLILGEPHAEFSERVKQYIQDFYDLRSKFVHGSLETFHPLSDRNENEYEIADTPVANARDRILVNSAFATTLVLATLQHFIANGWRNLSFSSPTEFLIDALPDHDSA